LVETQLLKELQLGPMAKLELVLVIKFIMVVRIIEFMLTEQLLMVFKAPEVVITMAEQLLKQEKVGLILLIGLVVVELGLLLKKVLLEFVAKLESKLMLVLVV